MIETNAGTGKKVVALTVIHCNPVAVEFCNTIGATRVKWSLF
jgi:hypothetical protein